MSHRASRQSCNFLRAHSHPASHSSRKRLEPNTLPCAIESSWRLLFDYRAERPWSFSTTSVSFVRRSALYRLSALAALDSTPSGPLTLGLSSMESCQSNAQPVDRLAARALERHAVDCQNAAWRFS